MLVEDKRKPRGIAVQEIARAFQNDPRTAMAQAALAQGSNTRPTAGGGWAWADGIARALQGAMGGYAMKRQMQEYGKDQDQYMADQAQLAADTRAAMSPQPPAAAPANAVQPTPPAMAPGGGISAAAAAFSPQQAPNPSPASAPLPAAPQASYAAPVPQEGAGRGMRPFGSGQTAAPAARSSDFRSYKSSAYVPLENKFEQQYGLPAGLLTSIRMNGERSNSDQVSSAGARSVYQFTPSTRSLFMEKHGIDPWSSPEAAAQSAAIHLAESLKRGNSVAGAVGEYIGGPSRKAWGKTTRGYIRRVMNGMGAAQEAQTSDPSFGGIVDTSPQPDLPQTVDRPEAPKAEGATSSRTLDAALRMMENGNAYMANDARDLYTKGLGAQDEFDEAATRRRQAVADNEYQSDSANWRDAQSAARGNQYQERRDWQQNQYNTQSQAREFSQRNQERQEGYAQQDRMQANEFAHSDRQQQRNLDFQRWQTGQEIQGRKDVAAQQIAGRRAANLGTATGLKLQQSASDIVGTNTQALGILDEMDKLLAQTKTGGAVLGNVPGLQTWANTNLQRLEALSNELALGKAQEMKGALSDNDVKFLQSMVPNIRRTNRANREDIVRMRNILERANDFQISRIEAFGDNDTSFMRNWDAYVRSVPAGSKSFNEWKSSVPKFDATGKRIN